jgi:hypothetical protein
MSPSTRHSADKGMHDIQIVTHGSNASYRSTFKLKGSFENSREHTVRDLMNGRDLHSAFRYAIKQEDPGTARRIIQVWREQYTTTYILSNFEYALCSFLAAENRSLGLVKYICDLPRSRETYNCEPVRMALFGAIFSQSVEIIDWLFDNHKADICTWDTRPIKLACTEGSYQVLPTLLRNLVPACFDLAEDDFDYFANYAFSSHCIKTMEVLMQYMQSRNMDTERQRVLLNTLKAIEKCAETCQRPTVDIVDWIPSITVDFCIEKKFEKAESLAESYKKLGRNSSLNPAFDRILQDGASFFSGENHGRLAECLLQNNMSLLYNLMEKFEPMSLLGYAIECRRYIEIDSLLVDQKLDWNTISSIKRLSMLDNEVVQYVLARYSPLDTVAINALYKAIENGSFELAKTWVKYRPKLFADRDSVLKLLMCGSFHNMRRFIVEHIGVDVVDEYKAMQSVFEKACEFGMLSLCRELVDKVWIDTYTTKSLVASHGLPMRRFLRSHSDRYVTTVWVQAHNYVRKEYLFGKTRYRPLSTLKYERFHAECKRIPQPSTHIANQFMSWESNKDIQIRPVDRNSK